jgi:hypothetical protein
MQRVATVESAMDVNVRTDVPALRHVVVTGALFTVAAAITGGVRAAASCAAGAAVATVNLWLLARVVGAFVARAGAGARGWGAAATMRAVLLYAAVAVIVLAPSARPGERGLVDMVPFLVGLLALPAGIVVRALVPSSGRAGRVP